MLRLFAFKHGGHETFIVAETMERAVSVWKDDRNWTYGSDEPENVRLIEGRVLVDKEADNG